MIISIDSEKAFDKIQHPFVIETLQKGDREGTYLNILKTMYDKPTASIILSSRKLKSFPLRSGVRWGCPLSTLLFSIVLRVLVTAIREVKGIQIGKEEVTPSLFADDMTLYIEDSAVLPENYSCMLSHFNRVQLCAKLWTAACQAPLSMEFSRQEYWSGLPFPSPRDLPNPGTEPESLMFPASSVFLSLVSHLAKRKLLELNNEFGKIANDKINTQKSVSLLYANNKRSEEKFKKQFHLPLHQKE